MGRKKNKAMKRFEFDLRRGLRVPTPDDWYPTLEGGFVEMKSMQLSDGTWRICFWGGDDFGMEHDTKDREVHRALLRRIPSVVTIKGLEELGFKRA